jgi:nitrogen fixation NifU-like protein
MAKYPTYLLEHFRNPKNVGEILNPDGVGIACNIPCGDIMQMFIKCHGDKISEVTSKTFGCGAAIAASSILTERIKGSAVDEALKISEGILEGILSQLPEEKISCFKLAVNALKLAIEEYRDKSELAEAYEKQSMNSKVKAQSIRKLLMDLA